eukprot:3940642-Rhodomonas_salina.2
MGLCWGSPKEPKPTMSGMSTMRHTMGAKICVYVAPKELVSLVPPLTPARRVELCEEVLEALKAMPLKPLKPKPRVQGDGIYIVPRAKRDFALESREVIEGRLQGVLGSVEFGIKARPCDAAKIRGEYWVRLEALNVLHEIIYGLPQTVAYMAARKAEREEADVWRHALRNAIEVYFAGCKDFAGCKEVSYLLRVSNGDGCDEGLDGARGDDCVACG